MTEYVLNMSNVIVDTKIRKKVLNIKNFAMRRGELVAVVGPNGAGKSTFLQAINLLKSWQGEMRLFGQDVCNADKTLFRRRSALVFQEMLLLNDTVYNNVARGLRFRGVSESEIKTKVYKALSDFCCDHLADRFARSLSGGEAQRVCIARALVTDPELLLLDEPSASLDVAMRNELIQKIRQIAEERGISVILVSHNFTDVLLFAERAVAMFDGSIVQDDKPETLMRRPVNNEVARLVGMDNILPCSIEQVKEESIVRLNNNLKFIYPKKLNEKNNLCCISGDSIQIFDDSVLIEQQEWVVFEGTVKEVSPDIGSYRVVVELVDQILIARVSRMSIKGKIFKNALIKLLFKLEDVHFIQ